MPSHLKDSFSASHSGLGLVFKLCLEQSSLGVYTAPVCVPVCLGQPTGLFKFLKGVGLK